jgi:hypothetical protein
MKSQILFLSIILILAFSVSCISKKSLTEPKTVILPLGDTLNLADGSIVYGLPLTVFDIVVDVERDLEKPGPYARFAGDMLGLKDVITTEKETWSIKSVKIKSLEELDPSEFYVIESNTLFQSNVLALKSEGLILDLNPAVFEKNKKNTKDNPVLKEQTGFFDLGSDEYFVTQVDTAFRLVKLDTSFIKIPYLVERKKQLSAEQLAERAAKSLLELREGKHLILTGEANVFPQDKSAIDEMNRLEREYLSLFCGKILSEHKTYSFSLIPEKEMLDEPVIIFRFSKNRGISEAADNTSAPITIEFTPAKKTKDVTIVNKQSGSLVPGQKYDKLYYRVPEIVSVNIKEGTKNIYSSRKLIYQFGEVIQLPANYIIGK